MKENILDTDYLRQWIGNTEITEQTISVEPLHRMRATLDYSADPINPGAELPPLWHWIYFITPTRASELGHDGHAALGQFMPPVPLPRRMWAGGRFEFNAAIRVGETARRVSTIRDVKVKHGRSGTLCFVEVEHCIFVANELRFSEVHNIVYRDAPRPGEPAVVPTLAAQDAQWTREVTPSSTLLFRYSALTFNSHRIHYDLDFCRQVEGYPGLVFHGPLTATLLLELAREKNPGQVLAAYEFRAHSPLFDHAPFTINGKMEGNKVILWAANADKRLAMTATLSFSD